ncbi:MULTISPECIES: DUF397 domain-containing protein [unclassified Streptomyces]|uniref:DUF397 domain-containing protein n=1 Tax=unclassified Streptomyces TaxID=2593676 RepID=UPI002E26061D
MWTTASSGPSPRPPSASSDNSVETRGGWGKPSATPTIAVRDSKTPAGPVLSFRPDAFRQFVARGASTAVG